MVKCNVVRKTRDQRKIERLTMVDQGMNGTIKINSPRKTIEIVLPDGRVYTGNRGASLEELCRMLPEWDNPPIMGAVVNGELRELTTTIEMEARVRLVTMEMMMAHGFIALDHFFTGSCFRRAFSRHPNDARSLCFSKGILLPNRSTEPLTEAELERLKIACSNWSRWINHSKGSLCRCKKRC